MLALDLIFAGAIILTCVILNNASNRLGVPMLLAFILLGLLFGNNINPQSNYHFAESACSIALVFIMFYGGFGTSWKSAKAVVVEAGLLASVGVFATAGITATLCHFILKWSWLKSLLMSAAISSTDAASVFSILRARKLGLKNNSAPMLEIESGSNDPCSYMLTAIILSMVHGGVTAGHVVWMVFSQLAFGALAGFLIAKGALFILKRFSFSTSGFDSLFLIAVALFSYGVPSAIGGNGYLSTYIVGIMIGNAPFFEKRQMVNFFDGLTGLMQVFIFFLLGVLAIPSKLGPAVLPAVAIFLFITFVARPLSVAAVLLPFRKYSLKQIGFISFVGLRGAASIVFAIMACCQYKPAMENGVFDIIFCLVLISIGLQGSFIPWAAKKFDMIDENTDVMKTFTDFGDENHMHFSQVPIAEDSEWKDKTVRELKVPRNLLLCLVIRPSGKRVVPKGDTRIELGDVVIVCSNVATTEQEIHILQHALSKNSKWTGHQVRDYPKHENEQLILIKRATGENIVPNGSTVLHEGDVLFINKG